MIIFVSLLAFGNDYERIRYCQAIKDDIYDKIIFAIETGHFPISHSLGKEEKNIYYILKKGNNN